METTFERIIQIQKELAKMKELYTELDVIAAQLLKIDFKSAVHNGQTINLVDNFREKNCVFRTTGFRRFEIKVD